ncbi:hypothetical protein, partial [Kitasatospora sp. NPDC093558]|uniref:hypothetical protein n=1 Tax=Kitasatospora sp. NPDC093558 TaxID=3155201 RepID=UPI00341282A2
QGDLPSAAALLALGSAAGVAMNRGGLPSAEVLLALGGGEAGAAGCERPVAEATALEVSLPALQKMGQALERPLPTQKGSAKGVSAAAAKLRSSTKKTPKKPTAAAGEQSAHLRRGVAAETQRTRKPNQR